MIISQYCMYHVLVVLHAYYVSAIGMHMVDQHSVMLLYLYYIILANPQYT